MATRLPLTKRLSLPVDRAKDPLPSPKAAYATVARKRSWKLRRKKSNDTALENSALEELYVHSAPATRTTLGRRCLRNVLVEDEEVALAQALVAQLQAFEMATGGGALVRLLAREGRARPLVAWALERAGASESGIGEFWFSADVGAIPGGNEAAWWLLLRENLLVTGGELLFPWLQEHLSATLGQKLVVDHSASPWYHDTTGIACPRQGYDQQLRAELAPVLLDMLEMLTAALKGDLPHSFLGTLSDCAFSPLVAGEEKYTDPEAKERNPSKKARKRSEVFLLHALVVAFIMPAVCRLIPSDASQTNAKEVLLQAAQLLRDIVLGNFSSVGAEGVFEQCDVKKARKVVKGFEEAVQKDLYAKLAAGEQSEESEESKEETSAEHALEDDLLAVKSAISTYLTALWPICLKNPYGRVLLQIFAKQGLRKVDL